ncbi:hypothetical protein [Methylophaga thalassica]|uniref:hypothetical protein n=1 Tax=Methylophaga aminisulfidivorans TaxID=230105 RepID=UPI003A933845
MKQPSRLLQSPVHPYLVLLIAIVLPGVGQVVNHNPMRGLTMLFFMLVLGVVTYQMAAPGISVIGQFAGGIFIYALSIMDAYMWARIRWEQANFSQ